MHKVYVTQLLTFRITS